jgi:DNA-binding MarR family transcriptional regulator
MEPSRKKDLHTSARAPSTGSAPVADAEKIDPDPDATVPGSGSEAAVAGIGSEAVVLGIGVEAVVPGTEADGPMPGTEGGRSTPVTEAEKAKTQALLEEILGPSVRPAQLVPHEDIPFRAVGFALSSLGHAVTPKFSARLAPLGLEPREFALLRRVGVSEGGSQQAMGERLGIPASRMVALVDELEGRDLLERRPSPRDRRAHALHLTPDGRSALAKALEVAATFEGELTRSLSAEERAQLIELLDRIAAELGVPPGVHGSQLAG